MRYGREQERIEALMERCRERGYKFPIIFDSEWGYKRAKCPECHTDHLLRGYLRHFNIMHTEAGDEYRKKHVVPKTYKKKEPYSPVGRKLRPEDSRSPEPIRNEWESRSNAAIRRILESTKPGGTKYQPSVIERKLF